MFRRDTTTMSSAGAKALALEIATELDGPNRYFGYRDNPYCLWTHSASLETGWQMNELMEAAR